MKMEKSNNLQVTISKLDDLLIGGQLRYTTLRQKYFQIKDNEGFVLNDYILEVTNSLNEWFSSVVKVLDEDFIEKYHWFHFVQHKGSSMALGGFPLDLSNWLVKYTEHMYALEDIILRLEERRNLVVRQEIADKEYEADILYKITYSEHTREIKLNNMILARLQSDSKNVNFFEYVYSHSNQQLAVSDIEKDTAYALSSNIQDILRDLGFKENIRKVFFPIATKAKVMFVNPITKQYATKNDLPVIRLSKVNETERETTSQNE